jgi:hypothetical protein
LNQLESTNIRFNAKSLKKIYNRHSHLGSRFSVTSRGIPDLLDGVNKIHTYDGAEEWDWNTLHQEFIGTIIEDIFWALKEEWILGRGRFMTLSSSNRALSYHWDECYRLHIPVYTNENSWFMLEDKNMHQILEEGRLYILDATRFHSAMNLDQSKKRTHLVFSAKKLSN